MAGNYGFATVAFAMQGLSGGYILPKSQKGVSTDLSDWLPLDTLQRIAIQVLADSVSPQLDPQPDRIDARPDKGILKFTFNDHYWEIGQLLIERRLVCNFPVAGLAAHRADAGE